MKTRTPPSSSAGEFELLVVLAVLPGKLQI